MSVRPLGLNKWQIDFFPAGCKGKRERITHRGTEHAAQKLEIELRRQNKPSASINPSIRDIIPEFLQHEVAEGRAFKIHLTSGIN